MSLFPNIVYSEYSALKSFKVNLVNIMAAEVLVPSVTRASADMVLTM